MKKICCLSFLLAFFWSCTGSSGGSATATRPDPHTQEPSQDGTVTQVAEDADTTGANAVIGSILTGLQDSLQRLQPARNREVDFLRMVELHLQAAGRLSDREGIRGRDPLLKAMAQEMSRKRNEERADLAAFRSGGAKGERNDAFYKEALALIRARPVSPGTETPEDRQFAEVTVRLQERIILLAEAYLEGSGDPALEGKARSLIRTHKREREQLSGWLQKNAE